MGQQQTSFTSNSHAPVQAQNSNFTALPPGTGTDTSTCGPNQACYQGLCAPNCKTATDCPPYYQCTPDGHCFLPCSTNNPCPTGFTCGNNGQCQAPCQKDADCSSGQSCFVGDGTKSYCSTGQQVRLPYQQAISRDGGATCSIGPNSPGCVAYNSTTRKVAPASNCTDASATWLYDNVNAQLYNPEAKCFLQATGGAAPGSTVCSGTPDFTQQITFKPGVPTTNMNGVTYTNPSKTGANVYCLSDFQNQGGDTNWNVCDPHAAQCTNTSINAFGTC